MNLQFIIDNIEDIDKEAMFQARERWGKIAKPLNSMGLLEEAVIRIAGLTGESRVSLKKRCVVPICSDNGVVEEGVTQTGKEVTAIVSRNFSREKTSVCCMAKVANCDVIPVDLGVAEDIDDGKIIINKISYGTKNIVKEPAMTKEQLLEAIFFGVSFVERLKKQGYNLIGTGEMGIGNTTTSSAITAVLLSKDVALVTGSGAGLSRDGIKHKVQVIRRAIDENQPNSQDVLDVLAKIGGYDIAGMCGLFLGGALYKVPVILDGFVSSVAALCAVKITPLARNCMLASHLSKEPAAKLILQELDLEPIISAQMSVGEGTGAVAAMPLLDMACAVYNEMPSFEEIAIDAYKSFS